MNAPPCILGCRPAVCWLLWPSPRPERAAQPANANTWCRKWKDASLHLTEGKRRFERHFSVSPAVGKLGTDDLFALRLAYNPVAWLGWEISLGHNPASSLHSLIHTFNALLRYPLAARFQPYGTLGYGMMTVYPGQAVKADPVTKNTVTIGGGLELYVRDDVALRGEMRMATVIGQDPGRTTRWPTTTGSTPWVWFSIATWGNDTQPSGRIGGRTGRETRDEHDSHEPASATVGLSLVAVPCWRWPAAATALPMMSSSRRRAPRPSSSSRPRARKP